MDIQGLSRRVGECIIVYTYGLRGCLVNLPGDISVKLTKKNVLAQDVAVELVVEETLKSSGTQLRSSSSLDRQIGFGSVFVGWTGFDSKVCKSLASVGKYQKYHSTTQFSAVEINPSLASAVGLVNGQRIGVKIHIKPPEVKIIGIEPATVSDWELIELNAGFLEQNFLAQVRVVPNPSFKPVGNAKRNSLLFNHPILLHLSPSISATVLVSYVEPVPDSLIRVVKISPESEVIVTPKSRTSIHKGSSLVHTGEMTESRLPSETLDKSGRNVNKDGMLMRGVDRFIAAKFFGNANDGNSGLKVWVSRQMLVSDQFKGIKFVQVSLVEPNGLKDTSLLSDDLEGEKLAHQIIAELDYWRFSPGDRHVALSSYLCKILRVQDMTGFMVRLRAAPRALNMIGLKDKTRLKGVQEVKIYPIDAKSTSLIDRECWGKVNSCQNQDSVESIAFKHFSSNESLTNSLLTGPITDGMLIPMEIDCINKIQWPGGVVRFEPLLSEESRRDGITPRWINGGIEEVKVKIETAQLLNPLKELSKWNPGVSVPTRFGEYSGIDEILKTIYFWVTNSFSVLVTGALGSGKTTIGQLIVHKLSTELLYSSVYISCKSQVIDEQNTSAQGLLKQAIEYARWTCLLGGKAIVVLDDVDRIIGAETEEKGSNENQRSSMICDFLRESFRRCGGVNGNVVILATANNVDTVNKSIIRSDFIRETIRLKAPTKEERNKMFRSILEGKNMGSVKREEVNLKDITNQPGQDKVEVENKENGMRRGDSEGNKKAMMVIDGDIDYNDVARQTDGYMPGDLVLLAQRAKNEVMMRCMNTGEEYMVKKGDICEALRGFTPASLRNVKLQKSTIRWDSIGGLGKVKKLLLETLQYPTAYGPLFNKCTLRLRSGILLYGYPGCGKTLLASAVAGECGLNFISVKGPEVLNKYIGASEKGIRDLFERAEAARPCVLFFDEFDSLASKRGHDSTGVTDRVVNQLLTLMDGAEGLKGVYVLAATSRPDLIDAALLRPGRLDKSILCDLPDIQERYEILKAVSKNMNIGEDVMRGDKLTEIARLTQGYSGADMQAILQNSQLEAIQELLEEEKLKQDNSSLYEVNKVANEIAYIQFAYCEETYEFGKDRVGKVIRGEEGRNELRPDILKMYRGINQKGMEGGRVEGLRERSEEVGKNVEGIVVQWRHIWKGYKSSQASLSEKERKRYGSIYDRFVAGRRGKEGEEKEEGILGVGTRTTLM